MEPFHIDETNVPRDQGGVFYATSRSIIAPSHSCSATRCVSDKTHQMRATPARRDDMLCD